VNLFSVYMGADAFVFNTEGEFIDWAISEHHAVDWQDAHALLNQLENLGYVTKFNTAA
jgi:hypothetical protein